MGSTTQKKADVEERIAELLDAKNVIITQETETPNVSIYTYGSVPEYKIPVGWKFKNASSSGDLLRVVLEKED